MTKRAGPAETHGLASKHSPGHFAVNQSHVLQSVILGAPLSSMASFTSAASASASS